MSGSDEDGARILKRGGALPFIAFIACIALLGPACSKTGRYRLSWSFEGESGPEGVAAACGRHGVSLIAVAESDSGGAIASGAVVPCSFGTVVREVAPGLYGLSVSGRNARGADKEPPESMFLRATAEVTVVEGDATPPADGAGAVSVSLRPQPACRDGVDNDCDGRVDLDDSACANPDGPSESAAGSGEACPGGGGGGPDASAPDAAGGDAGGGTDTAAGDAAAGPDGGSDDGGGGAGGGADGGAGDDSGAGAGG